MVTVRLPTILRPLADGAATVDAEGSTAGEVLHDLVRRHPGLADRLFDEAGEVQRFCNVFVGDEDVRYLEGLRTPVPGGADLTIVPAVSGGTARRGAT